MSDRSCIPCSTVFYTPQDLIKHKASHKNHREDQDSDKTTSKLGATRLRASTHTTKADTSVTTGAEPSMTESLPNHFLPKWWREKNKPETALRKRPNHEFPWASPALNEAVYPLLRSELLDSERRKSDGFPISLAIFRYMQMTNTEVNNTKKVLPLPQAGSRPEVKTYAALVIDCEMVELEDQVQDLWAASNAGVPASPACTLASSATRRRGTAS
ncbi:hypothetical protein NPX13_g9855 [Xylaria arbuscula]|uniref:C2H2-type domain-containing protein n=1 Tax=Xylaria arbuscula TaxID=114810 RepID=A0A9W8TIM5_9PEZI|nr:hypothetical protein NPX13_g9855 [Xylaria arbuscula]